MSPPTWGPGAPGSSPADGRQARRAGRRAPYLVEGGLTWGCSWVGQNPRGVVLEVVVESSFVVSGGVVDGGTEDAVGGGGGGVVGGVVRLGITTHGPPQSRTMPGKSCLSALRMPLLGSGSTPGWANG